MQLTYTRASGPFATAGPVHPGHAVRPITAGDLRSVGELYFASYPGGEAGTVDEAIADVEASWQGAYGRWAAEGSLGATDRDGVILAAIITVHDPPWPDVEDTTFIIDLFVNPMHRGRGLATSLARGGAVEAFPEASIGLRVESTNVAAVRLYERLGFEPRMGRP